MKEVQLPLNFGIHRPSVKERAAQKPVGLDPGRPTEDMNNVQVAQDGTRVREQTDAQGRVTLTMDNQVSHFAPNGMEIHDTKEGTTVGLPGGYQISHESGHKPHVTDADGNLMVGKPKYSNKGPKTVVGYTFKNGEGHEVSVDLKDMSFKIEDPKSKVTQEFDPSGGQKITTTHLFRDPDTGNYTSQKVHLEMTPEGVVNNKGDGKVSINPTEMQFENKLGAKFRPQLPMPLPERAQLGEGVELLMPKEAPPSAQPQAPVEAPPVDPKQIEDKLGILRPEDAGELSTGQPPSEPATQVDQVTHDPGHPNPPSGPPFGPPHSMTGSGMMRMNNPEVGMAIQLQANGIAMQKVPGQEPIAFDNRSATMGRVPTEAEKRALPVQVSMREREGLPPEEVYKFQDTSNNEYTFFSHSGDFLVESPDKKVGSIVYPDGTIHTRVEAPGNQFYDAVYHPMKGMQTSNGAQYNPQDPDALYIPSADGSFMKAGLPYPPRAEMGMIAAGGMPTNEPLPISGEMPQAFRNSTPPR